MSYVLNVKVKLTIAALLASTAALGACTTPTPATDSTKSLPVAASGHQAGEETTHHDDGVEETSIRESSLVTNPSGGSAPCEIVAYSNSAENDLTAAKATRPDLGKSTITELVAGACGSADYRDGQWVFQDDELEVGMLDNGTVHRITLRG